MGEKLGINWGCQMLRPDTYSSDTYSSYSFNPPGDGHLFFPQDLLLFPSPQIVG
jgi:hypothetical protein